MNGNGRPVERSVYGKCLFDAYCIYMCGHWVTETLAMTFFKTVVGELYEHTDEPTLTWLPSFRYEGEDGVRVSFLSCTLTPTNDERTTGLEIHVYMYIIH